MPEKLTIIIPTLNESRHIGSTLQALGHEPELEVVVADGGSEDETLKIAENFIVRVIHAPRGRASQMNAGAREARCENLLFLHADTRLPEGFSRIVIECLQRREIVAGAFKLSIDLQGITARIVEKGANWRSCKLKMPYGDQTLFLKSKLFHKLGGYPDIPFMEDFSFVRQLKRVGAIVILDMYAITSGRRWQQRGVIGTTLINQLFIAGFLLGVPPRVLSRFYYGRKISQR